MDCCRDSSSATTRSSTGELCFFHAPRRPSSTLAEQLGCDTTDEGAVTINAMCQTSVAGVYAAGDLAHPAGLPFPPAFVIIAAAQGAIGGGAIDRDLLTADLGRISSP
jgi:thioredoxin reductase